MARIAANDNRTLFVAAAVLPCALALLAAAACCVAALAGRPLYGVAPGDLTLAEAVTLGDKAEIVRMLENGADPDVPARVRPGYLDDQPHTLTPMAAAIAVARPDIIELLSTAGPALQAERLAPQPTEQSGH